MYMPSSMDSSGINIPITWTRHGLVLPRSSSGSDYGVMGDPCIVWDDKRSTWRMVLFSDPPGHGQAICTRIANGLPVEWSAVEPIPFTGPPRQMHKPYIVQEAHRPNRAAMIEGQYWLLGVMIDNGRKFIQRARATNLDGPWTWDDGPLIPTGGPGAFDEKHADAVSGFYFPERHEVLYFYMGYPSVPQDRPLSPWGNGQGLAIQKANEVRAWKLGEFLSPVPHPEHWASGYFGGFQLLPGKTHRWIAVLNASPTAPIPEDHSVAREEPAPSLGGWAWCDEPWPIRNWHLAPEPIEWIEDVPEDAVANGEGTNLWRQQALVLPDGRVALYYNSGSYGKEQLYLKIGA